MILPNIFLSEGFYSLKLTSKFTCLCPEMIERKVVELGNLETRMTEIYRATLKVTGKSEKRNCHLAL